MLGGFVNKSNLPYKSHYISKNILGFLIIDFSRTAIFILWHWSVYHLWAEHLNLTYSQCNLTIVNWRNNPVKTKTSWLVNFRGVGEGDENLLNKKICLTHGKPGLVARGQKIFIMFFFLNLLQPTILYYNSLSKNKQKTMLVIAIDMHRNCLSKNALRT